jgi:large subunit ribosomal protein L22
MQVVARATALRTSPRKVRLVAGVIRSLSLDQALTNLKFLRKRAAQQLLKVLKQAQGNAVNNFKLAKDNLVIKTIEINAGPILKRFRAVSRGRGHSIMKRTSNIKVILEAKTAGKPISAKASAR